MSLHKRDLQDEIIYRTGYTPCPNELFEVLKGKPYAFMVWMYIFKQSEGWNPSYSKMTEDLGISRDTVIKAVKILEEKNLLVIHTGGQINGANETNKYDLLPIKKWDLSCSSGGSKIMGGVAQNLDHPGLPQKQGGVVDVVDQGVVDENDWNKDKEEKDNLGAKENFKIQETKIPQAPKETQTKTIPEPQVNKPTPRDILRSWKRALPDKPSFDSRLSFLEDLFATIAKAGYREEDLPRNFKDDALTPWVGQKSKEHAIRMSNEDYEKALAVLSPDVQIISAAPVKHKMTVRKESSNYEMDVDVALSMITDDDEIQRMVEEHQKLLRGEK